ncbi:hypothetical protein [Spiribacter vilamensis]|uniref:Uncharacterized protein n=1 Tax=Spiribacter vilamensis TaxID=531306 RepID=A0A4Q8D1Z6_9GAMM|nr:hypothetical protein [Spiribacter vilamensis]RZU99406.1 hypothetical protein EV698_1696 [Spiribacter vilamensis]TVO61619.1 hypothetical protein FPL09_05750 [Spiribacter vilamensis]
MNTHLDATWAITFRTLFFRAIIYVLVIGAIAQGAYWEAQYLPEVRFSELGFTELTQTCVLITSCLLLVYIRQVLQIWPNLTLLLLAFVAASLVREQDAFLDHYVATHTWKILVSLIVIPSITWVVIQRRRFLAEFARYSNTLSLGLFTAGILVTYAFSRLFGRQVFWRAVMQEGYMRDVKDMAEEVIELLGYSIILIAIVELLLLARRIYRSH